MTAPDDLFTGLVEGESYQVGTSPECPSGSGGIRWDLFRYERPRPEMAFGRDVPMWCQIASCVRPIPVDYREAALEWLRELGYDPDVMDVGLFLMPRAVEQQVVERLRPTSKGTG